MRGALGAASAPAPPGPAPGGGCGRVPPAAAEPPGLIPSPPAGRRPIPAGTGAAPPAVTWGRPHRGRRKEPEPEPPPPLPRRAQPGTHPRDTGRRQGGQRGRAAPLFQRSCWFGGFFSCLPCELHCIFFYYYYYSYFAGISLDGLSTAPCPHGHARLRSRHAAM